MIGLNNLNTIIVSNNQIEKIPKNFVLEGLHKINLSHNKLNSIKELCDLPLLKELKLNEN